MFKIPKSNVQCTEPKPKRSSGKDGQAYAWNSGALTPLDPAQGAALRQQLLARHARTEAAERPRAELRLDPASKNELARIGYAGD